MRDLIYVSPPHLLPFLVRLICRNALLRVRAEVDSRNRKDIPNRSLADAVTSDPTEKKIKLSLCLTN
jgi:hypothetical protein